MIRRLIFAAAATLGLAIGLMAYAAPAHAQGTAQAGSATAQSAQSYETYAVQQGDTLAKIAVRYCTTWQEIYQINYGVIGDDPSLLEKGMILTVPNECSSGGAGSGYGGGSTSSGGSGGGYGGASGIYDSGPRTHATGAFRSPYYFVAWGDTLNGISQRFGVSVSAIMQANYLTNSNIYAGQALIIPGTGTPPPTPDAERVQFAWGAVSAALGLSQPRRDQELRAGSRCRSNHAGHRQQLWPAVGHQRDGAGQRAPLGADQRPELPVDDSDNAAYDR